MIRVLHIIEELSAVGGTPRKMLALARNAPAGVQHEFLAMRAGGLDAEFRALTELRVIESTHPIKLIGAAISMARARRTDVISTHFSRGLLCGSVVSAMTGLPMIHNEHGPASDPSAATAGTRAKLRLRGAAIRQARSVICNSAFTAATIRSVYGVSEGRLAVIYNPVEPRSAPSAQIPAPQGPRPLAIGHVGGMIEVRDQRRMIEALRILMDRGLAARLILIGDGPLRGALETEARRLNVATQVEFRGYRTDLSGFFAEIDVYVNAAIAEGFGIAIVEAMLARVPVVLANAGSHPELVPDAETGVLFEPGCAVSLADGIERLAGDRGLRAAMADRAQAWASQAFHPQRYASGYEGIVLAAHRGSQRRQAQDGAVA